ncbi:MAG: condensation domain-containing protein, partial [Planctomycetota bacterium]
MTTLTSPQLGIWGEQLLRPDDPCFNIGGYLRIPCALDISRLRLALRLTLDQCDAFGCGLSVSPQGEPIQTAAPPTKLEQVDLSSTDNPESEAESWMHRRIAEPIPFDGTSLLRCSVLKAAPDLNFIFLAAHHIAVDGWGMSLLVQTLAANYNGETPPVTTPYQSFADADAAYLKSDAFDGDADYWTSRFTSPHDQLLPNLAIDRGSGSISRRRSFSISRECFRELEVLGQRAGGSAMQVVLAAIHCCLSRLHRRHTIVFGVPVLNRGTPAQRRVVGMCTSVLPLVVDGRRRRFDELARALALDLRQAYRHRRFTAHGLSRRLGLNAPVYQALFSYERHDYCVKFDSTP